MQVLVVEDERRLAEAIAQILKEKKYLVDVVYNGKDGLDYALSGIYDVVILDVMLPFKSGFDVVSEMRSKKVTTPVLILSARDTIDDKITGLNKGADDYMTKPFAPEELLARVKALTRRQGEVVMDKLAFADINLTFSDYSLGSGEKCVHLGFKEFEIMKILMSNARLSVPKSL